MNRQFHVPAPDMLWGEPSSAIDPRTTASDPTHAATWKAFVCVAFVIDTYARRTVGRSVSTIPQAIAHRARTDGATLDDRP